MSDTTQHCPLCESYARERDASEQLAGRYRLALGEIATKCRRFESAIRVARAAIHRR